MPDSAAHSQPHPPILNERQRACLQIIDEIDRRNEHYFTQEWDVVQQGEPPPAEAWRWIHFDYDIATGTRETELKRRLQAINISGAGAKATLKALWTRHAIRIRHESLGRYRVLSLQMTETGRKLARRP